MSIIDLTETRKKLNKLDKELIRILSKRMSLAEDVAKFKKVHDMPIRQPEREEEIIQSKRKLAEKLKLNPDFIEKILQIIMDEGSRLQEEIINKL